MDTTTTCTPSTSLYLRQLHVQVCEMKLYRLQCGVPGNHSVEHMKSWFSAHATPYFSAFTLIPCLGFWQGRPETSITFEVVCRSESDDFEILMNLKRIAAQYNTDFDQQCTLLSNWYLPHVEVVSEHASATAAA